MYKDKKLLYVIYTNTRSCKVSDKNSILSQVLQQVKRYDFKKRVSKYKADKNVSELKCFSLLVVLLFAQIRRKESIRDIIIDLKIFESDLYHLNLKEIKKSTLSDSMKNRDYEYLKIFIMIYFKVLIDHKNENLNEK